MSNSLDFILVPFARYGGRIQPERIGLFLAEPPRRPARSRASDRLILYFTISGYQPFPTNEGEQILIDLAKIYYKTPGSVTAALRKVAEELNIQLLKRNVQDSGSGSQIVGNLTLVALRRGQIYLAQSGEMYALLLQAERSQYFYDSGMEGRGLGQSSNAPINYYHTVLQTDDILLLTAKPSPSWSVDTLAGIRGQELEDLKRGLFTNTGSDLNAVLILAKPGKGKISLSHVATDSLQIAQPEITEDLSLEEKIPPVVPLPPPPLDIPEPAEEAQVVVPEPVEDEITTPSGPVEAPGSQEPVVPPVPPPPPEAAATEEDQAVDVPSQDQPAQSTIRQPPISKILTAIGVFLMGILRMIANGLRAVLVFLLPDQGFFSMPASTMAFIAVAVPVVIATIAIVAYFQLGRASQYEELYAQAERMAVQAIGQTDLDSRRADWETVLDILDHTEDVRVTAETQALRKEAQNVLDGFDIVKRINFQPAIVGGLPDSVNVTQMVVADSDLYMLDGSNGSVIRARLGNQGFEVDQSFQCGSGTGDVSLDGSLVDIVPWQGGNRPDATILAMDASGNVLFCQPEESSQPAKLATSPSMSGEELKAMTIDLGNLYVLDPASNAVWIYWNNKIGEQPQLFFGNEVPEMQDAVDLMVNNDELYLLHSDGYVTLCVFSDLGVAPTRCSKPAYIDFRPGKENTPMVLEQPFTQILLNPPPDPSIYLLDPENQAINHFSLRSLTYQRQYASREPLPGETATAFAIDPVERYIFLAIGNEVYYGAIP
jgi:nitrogen fixation-related uncharacterized protein